MTARFAALMLGLILAASGTAHARGPGEAQRVHASGLCWDPDVEFPVPCDPDDD